MVLWIIFAAMAAVAAIALLRPLTSKQSAVVKRSAYEAAVYREQLTSLRGDVERGVIGADEAKTARAEIGRRLLAIDGAAASDGDRFDDAILPKAGIRPVAIAVMAFIPLVSLGLYANQGAPGIPAAPASSRAAPGLQNQSINQLIARVEDHLRENPNDARGWQVLGPAMMRLGRFTDAAIAFQRLVTIEGPSADRLSQLGQALMLKNDGIISADATEAFSAAAVLDPGLPEPRYYLGIARVQDRDTEGAVAIWNKLLADSPADAPWRAEVESQIAGIQGSDVPGPDAEAVSAARAMTAGDRQAMIAGMVERLGTRLNTEGGTATEWVRLANAYRVLGDTDAYGQTVVRARVALKSDPEALTRFEAGIAIGEEG